MNWDTN
jgi:hypothetical protein